MHRSCGPAPTIYHRGAEIARTRAAADIVRRDVVRDLLEHSSHLRRRGLAAGRATFRCRRASIPSGGTDPIRDRRHAYLREKLCDVPVSTQHPDDLDRTDVGTIDDQVRVHRPEPQGLVSKVFAAVAYFGHLASSPRVARRAPSAPQRCCPSRCSPRSLGGRLAPPGTGRSAPRTRSSPEGPRFCRSPSGRPPVSSKTSSPDSASPRFSDANPLAIFLRISSRRSL